MTINYVFWDSDNTLVDTYQHHWRKHFETLKTRGINLGDEWQGKIYENNGAQNYDWLQKEYELTITKDDYLNQIDRWYFDHINEIKVRPGVIDALALFENVGLPMAVVSNGRRRSVMAALDGKNLTRHFRFVLCKEDYQGRKPDPEPYLASKTKFQQILGKPIDAAECLVIEDDPLGVAAGQAAGMTVLYRPVGDDDPADFIARCQRYLTKAP